MRVTVKVKVKVECSMSYFAPVAWISRRNEQELVPSSGSMTA